MALESSHISFLIRLFSQLPHKLLQYMRNYFSNQFSISWSWNFLLVMTKTLNSACQARSQEFWLEGAIIINEVMRKFLIGGRGPSSLSPGYAPVACLPDTQQFTYFVLSQNNTNSATSKNSRANFSAIQKLCHLMVRFQWVFMLGNFFCISWFVF